MNEKTIQAIEPLLLCSVSLSNQKLLLHKMFTSSVCNAPDNESDNFTAKEITPFYLALCETLENLDRLNSEKSF